MNDQEAKDLPQGTGANGVRVGVFRPRTTATQHDLATTSGSSTGMELSFHLFPKCIHIFYLLLLLRPRILAEYRSAP